MVTRDRAAMGAFLIGGFLLFGLGLLLIGDRRMLFTRSAEYYTQFDQVSALEVGAKVRVGGMDAGEVVDILVPNGPRSRFQVKFRVVEKLFNAIRTDSIASIATDGLLGNKFLLIDIGTTGRAPPGWALASKESVELGDLLARIRETVRAIDETVGAVKGDVTDAMKTVAESARHVDDIIVSVQGPISRVTAAATRISEDAGVIIERVRAGEGTIGKFTKDDAVYQSVSHSAKEVEETLGNLRQTSADVSALVSQFRAGDVPAAFERTVKNVSESSEKIKGLVAAFQPAPGGGGGVAGDLRATIGSAREAMADLAENLEALKRSFFFRGFFKDRGFYDLDSLSPREYLSKEFEKT